MPAGRESGWGGGGLPRRRLIKIWMRRWMEPHFHFWIDCNRIALFMQLLKWGRKMCYIRSKETKMGSIIGQ